jgi:hypothetical protein
MSHFSAVLRNKDADALQPWMDRANASGLPAIKNFVRKLQTFAISRPTVHAIELPAPPTGSMNCTEIAGEPQRISGDEFVQPQVVNVACDGRTH